MSKYFFSLIQNLVETLNTEDVYVGMHTK